MRKKWKQFMGVLLSLAMVLGLMPGMSLTALAWDGDPYASLLNTTTVVKFDNKDWYLIENHSTAVDAGTVTLLSKECIGASDRSGGVYIAKAYYMFEISDNAKLAVDGNSMFFLSTGQAVSITNADVRKCPQYPGTDYNNWWLDSPGEMWPLVAAVEGSTGYVNGSGC